MIQMSRPDPDLSLADRLLWLERNLVEMIEQHIQLTESVHKLLKSWSRQMSESIPTEASVLAVKCPYCGANPDSPCSGIRDGYQGKPRKLGPHPERVRAAKENSDA